METLKYRQLGFTIIELMVVVVIVGILMAIALPSYRDHVIRSHRADGKSGISQCAVNQERNFTKNNSHAAADVCAATSPDEYYNLTVVVFDQANDGTCTAGATNLDCFIITATPTTKDNQNEDTDCASFTMTNMNQKTAKNSSNADTTDDCWNR